MSVIISHGSQRFNTKAGTKFYGPWVNRDGRVLRLKRLHARALDAQNYAATFADRYERFVRAAERWADRQRKETMTISKLIWALLQAWLRNGNLKVQLQDTGLHWELKTDDVQVAGGALQIRVDW